MTRSSCCLAVMSKAPARGQVKTRLIPSLGSRRSAAVYDKLLGDTLARVSVNAHWDVELCVTPASHHIRFLQLSHRYGLRRSVQPRGGLGQKMSGIFSRLLQSYPYVIIIGADSPAIDHELIEQCCLSLQQGTDLFLGGTDDGGYALIGINQVKPELFRAMPWGTGRVLDITVKRARRTGMRVVVSRELWDVDTPKDYRRWRRWLGDQGKACVV